MIQATTGGINPADILTPEQLAERLGVPERWAYSRTRYRKGGGPALPFFKLGKYVRFSWTAVSAWLAETATTAPARPRKYRRKKARA